MKIKLLTTVIALSLTSSSSLLLASDFSEEDMQRAIEASRNIAFENQTRATKELSRREEEEKREERVRREEEFIEESRREYDEKIARQEELVDQSRRNVEEMTKQSNFFRQPKKEIGKREQILILEDRLITRTNNVNYIFMVQQDLQNELNEVKFKLNEHLQPLVEFKKTLDEARDTAISRRKHSDLYKKNDRIAEAAKIAEGTANFIEEQYLKLEIQLKEKEKQFQLDMIAIKEKFQQGEIDLFIEMGIAEETKFKIEALNSSLNDETKANLFADCFLIDEEAQSKLDEIIFSLNDETQTGFFAEDGDESDEEEEEEGELKEIHIYGKSKEKDNKMFRDISKFDGDGM